MTLKEIMAAADEYAAEAFALGVVGKTAENKAMAAKRAELESAIDALIADSEKLADLQHLLDSRPAINAGLLDTYTTWTHKVYQAEIHRSIFARHGAATLPVEHD